MRYIVYPDPIVVGENTIDFKRVLFDTWTLDPKFGKNLESILLAASIRTKFDKAVSGQLIELDDKEWALLSDVVTEPSQAYNPALTLPLIPFCLVITTALKERGHPAIAANGEARA